MKVMRVYVQDKVITFSDVRRFKGTNTAITFSYFDDVTKSWGQAFFPHTTITGFALLDSERETPKEFKEKGE